MWLSDSYINGRSCMVDNDIVLLSQAINQPTNPLASMPILGLAVASQDIICSDAAMQLCSVIRKILFICPTNSVVIRIILTTSHTHPYAPISPEK